MSTPPSTDSYDFFVSYTGKDKAWAEWIAWQLEAAGHKTIIQAWDFKSGGVFPGDMHRALQQSTRVLAVLTPDYMASGFCQPEWQAAFAKDPTGEKGILVCVRVVNFKPDGILTGRTYIDLVGLSDTAARDLLLQRIQTGRAKPTVAPTFPTATTATAPVFPGGRNDKPSIPNNLPRLQSFFGRDEELKTIREALDPESRTWGALIDGPGGMGKTSLAVRAAYDCTLDQFKRIIFISIKDREMEDDGERRLTSVLIPGLLEMLNELARELGQADITKSPEDQRIRLLLDALRDAQVLLILDNLESLTKEDRDQIFTFVKRLPQGCKAILTSRRRIGSSADTLILEKLDQAAALETLADLAKKNKLLAKTSEAERITLYNQTGGKPLLLRWVAGQLGRGSCRTFTDALYFLSSCPKENDPLEFIFGDLAKEFTEAETKVLCALTYFTQAVEVKHIAAVAGMGEATDFSLSSTPGGGEDQGEQEPKSSDAPLPSPLPARASQGEETGAQGDALVEVETALRTLANRSLVVPDQEEKAYALVPMVAEFLRKHRPEIVQVTGDRLEKHAYALIMENGWQKHDRFPVLEAAWPGIIPALPRFLVGDNARLQTVCHALWRFLDFQGHWDEGLALCEQGEAKAVAAADYDNAGWRAYHAGWIHHLRGQANSVFTYADRAAMHWDRSKASARECAFAISLRGLGHELNQNYPAAIAACRDALELWRSLANESVDVANCLNDLAGMEKLSGDLTAAEGHFREALRVARVVGADADAVTFVGNLALLALIREDWPTAETLAREALSLSEALHRQELIALNNHCLAQVLVRQGKATEALPYARRAVEIYAHLKHPSLESGLVTLRACES